MHKRLLTAILLFGTLALLALPKGALKLVSDEGLSPEVELQNGAQDLGGAVAFTGETGCQATVALPAEYNYSREFSISCWFNLEETPKVDLIPEGKRDCAVPFSRNWSWAARITPSLEFLGRMVLPDGADYTIGTGKATIALNQWNHVVVTYSTTQKAYRIFFNGVLLAESTGDDFQDIRLEDGTMVLGSDAENYNAFKGAIAGVNLFPRGLSVEEALALYDEIPTAIGGTMDKQIQETLLACDTLNTTDFGEEALASLAEQKALLTSLLGHADFASRQNFTRILEQVRFLQKDYPAARKELRQWCQALQGNDSPLAKRIHSLDKYAPLSIVSTVPLLAPEVDALREGKLADHALSYVVAPTSGTPVLPDSRLSTAQLGDTLECTLTPGEYEGVSFVLKPLQTYENVRFIMPDLTSENGEILSAAHLDFKYVLCWYQAGTAWEGVGQASAIRKLVPELMVNDPELVKIDPANQCDYVKLSTPCGQRYVCATRPEVRETKSRWQLSIPNEEYPVKDAPAPLPTTLEQDRNRQFIITVHADENTPAGLYTGCVRVLSEIGEICSMNLRVRVLPFTLETPKTNYDLQRDFTFSLYQVSTMSSKSQGAITPFERTPEQYRAELRNLARHGITNPLFYQYMAPADIDDFKKALRMRKEAGLLNKPLFLSGPECNLGIWTDTSEEALKRHHDLFMTLMDAVEEICGHRDVYFYAIDEAFDDVLKKERTIWEKVHEYGGKILTSSCDTRSVFNVVGDMLDLLVHCRVPNAAEAALWHGAGQRIFSYGNPQGGVENPDAYRRNYGLFLYQQNYDGSCTYCNYEAFGNPWDDFDHKDYRDHNLVYPTIDGVVDTIAYEGLREAADDIRYATTLRLAAQDARTKGRNALAEEAEEWLKNLDALHADLDQARVKMVDYILKLK